MFYQNTHLRAFACAVPTLRNTLPPLPSDELLFSLQLPNVTSAGEPSLIRSLPQLVGGLFVAHSSMFVLIVLVWLHLNNL